VPFSPDPIASGGAVYGRDTDLLASGADKH